MPATQSSRTGRRPPAPLPRTGAFGPLRLYRALRRNAITAWRADAFEEPYIADRNQLGGFVLLNDSDMIRHVLIDNAANYPKDALQLEKLTPAVGRGLLTAEGADWRLRAAPSRRCSSRRRSRPISPPWRFRSTRCSSAGRSMREPARRSTPRAR